MKKGLVLEGGAMRGLFTCGVIDVLMENNISFDGIMGVSAGACFGLNYKSHQIGRGLRYNVKYCKDEHYGTIRSLLKTGDIYEPEYCYYTLPEKLDVFDYETFKNDPTEFYAGCTDCVSGGPYYHRMTDCGPYDMKFLQASASMPLVSNVVKVGGHELLDGGIADSIPLRFMQDKGYDKNIVVLTQTENYVKKKNKALLLARIMLRDYPNVIETLKNRHIIYNDTVSYIKEEEAKGNIFVIRPKTKIPVSRIEKNPEKLKKAYDMGRAECEENLPRLKEYLGI